MGETSDCRETLEHQVERLRRIAAGDTSEKRYIERPGYYHVIGGLSLDALRAVLDQRDRMEEVLEHLWESGIIPSHFRPQAVIHTKTPSGGKQG